jgi:hypothetical protein
VVPQVLAGNLVLGNAALALQLGRDPLEQTRVGEQPKPDRRPFRREQLRQLGLDALAGQVAHEVRVRLDAGQRGGLDGEAERRRQPDGSDHPQRVLLEAGLRVADRAQRSRGDVVPSAVRVHEGRLASGAGAPGNGVGGEVPTGQVDLDHVTELHAMRPPEVGVVVVRAERGDLVQLPGVTDDHRAERVLVDRVGEDRDDLLGPSIGRQVPVERVAAQEDVAQRATHDVGGVAGPPERRHQLADRWGNGGPDRGLVAQFRPRNRYVRHASFRSSAR